jgi:cysteine desulfurase
MAANNETGAVNPLAEIGAVCREADVPLHVDAVQAAARMPLSVDAINASSVALSAHKMYGPKGVGALFVRRRRPRAKLAPIIYGGGHERNLRPGTLNVPGIVGFGEAASIIRSEAEPERIRERRMRDLFIMEIRARAPGEVIVNSPMDACLPQTINLRFAGVSAAGILRAISDQLAIASGSACSTTSVEPSHVLLAQGLSPPEVAESLRISFGRQTTEEELLAAITILARAVTELQSVRGVAGAAL